MAVLKLNKQVVKNLDTTGILNYTAARAANMTGNPYFPTPTPTVADLQLKAKRFQEDDANAKVNRSVLNTQTRRTAYNELLQTHFDMMGFIEAREDLTLDMLLTTGYTPYADRTEAELPPPADKPTYKTGANTGEVTLIAKPYKQGSHKVFYNWKVSEDQGLTWKALPVLNNSHRRLVTGLELMQEYWFKVAYATTAGEGEESAHISIVLTSDSRRMNRGQGKKQTTELRKAA